MTAVTATRRARLLSDLPNILHIPVSTGSGAIHSYILPAAQGLGYGPYSISLTDKRPSASLFSTRGCPFV